MDEVQATKRLARVQQAGLVGRGGLFVVFMILSALFGFASLILWFTAIFSPSWWAVPGTLAVSTGGLILFSLLWWWSYRSSQRQYQRLLHTQMEVAEMTEMQQAQGGSISVAMVDASTGQLSEAVDVGAISDAQEVADVASMEDVSFDFEQEEHIIHQAQPAKHEH